MSEEKIPEIGWEHHEFMHESLQRGKTIRKRILAAKKLGMTLKEYEEDLRKRKNKS